MKKHNRWINTGLFILVAGLGATLIWLVTAPIESAAIAPGIVTVEGYRKKIQHLEGGIVHSITVKEGEEVSMNQTLIQLKKTKPRTRFLQLKTQYINALAKLSRLEAELNGNSKIEFPNEIKKTENINLIAIKNQELLFRNQKKVIDGKLEVARTKEKQATEAKKAYTATSELDRRSVALINKQLAMTNKLLQRGYASRNQHLELEKDKLDIERKLSDFEARISKFDLDINEATQEQANIELSYINETNKELEKTEALKIELREQLIEAEDTLARTAIKSPIDGKVVGLSVHTIGGVISAGQVLMEVVPKNDKLIVEALLKTEDIDVVKKGQKSEVRLTAYNRRRTLPITGTVINISADRVSNESTKTSAYSIKIELDEGSIAENSEIELYPGMPAEVIIILGERTVLDYLLSPIYQSFNRAFRDSD